MSVILFFCVLAIVLWFTYRQFKNRRYNELFDKLPSPPGVPILGHIINFRSANDLLNTADEVLEEYDGLCTFRIGPTIRYVVTSNRHFVARLCTSNKVEKAQAYKIFEKWMGKNIFTTNGSAWKKYRSIFEPAVHVSMTKEYFQTFIYTGNILIEELKREVGKSVNVYKFVELWALDTIIEIILGISLNVQRDSESEYVKNIHEMVRILAARMSHPLKFDDFSFFFFKDYWTERKSVRFLKQYTKDMLEKKIAAMKNGNSKKDENLVGSKKRKIMAFLDIALDRRGIDLNDEEICSHTDGALFAGHDTVALVVACTLYFLSKHSDIQEKLFCEIRRYCGDDKTKHFSLEDVQSMTYLDMVVKESMRLCPPGPVIGKHTLEDIEHDGRVIPKNTEVLISLRSLHTREKYFPNPHVFDPERFAPDKNVEPFTYIPFGAGPRICIGQKPGLLSVKACISMFLRNYKLQPVEGFQMKLIPHAVQKPDSKGIRVFLENRNY